ncbi:hypothetical protein [Halogeometricum borinquense]|uniref:hypothetical protein n=1 Tax=Halogeometricum borinquense TaxID=60847 RepID=UPI00342E7C48
MATNATPSDNFDGHDQSTDSEPDWESVARDALVQLFFSRKSDLQGSLGTIESRIGTLSDSELTAEHIKQFRRDFYDVQRLVEEDIVPLVDGVEPYEDATLNLSYGRLAEGLDVRWDDVAELPRKSEIEANEEGDDADE